MTPTQIVTMDSSDHSTEFRARLRWRRPGRVRLRRGSDAAWGAIQTASPKRWSMGEARLAPSSRSRLLALDCEIVGSVSTARAILDRSFEIGLEELGPTELLDSLRPCPGGDWLLKAGLWFDRRLPLRCRPKTWRHIIHRAGPLVGALLADRYDLQGYFAAIFLSRAGEFAPTLTTRAFIQQVAAGAIDEPLLSAHLRYGARPVAFVDTEPQPIAIVRWKR